jgi:hypothetical protein
MPNEEQLERLLALLEANRVKTNKKNTKKSQIKIEEIAEPISPASPPQKVSIFSTPKRKYKKQLDEEKEQKIKQQLAEYLKPPEKKKKQPQEQPPQEQPPQEQPPQEQPPQEQPPQQPAKPSIEEHSAPPREDKQPLPAKTNDEVVSVIAQIENVFKPDIDALKLNQINAFIKSYKNRHI